MLALAIVLVGAAASAHAGTYTVAACDATGINRAFQPYGDTSFIVPEGGCKPQFTGSGFQPGGLRVRHNVNAPGRTATAPLFTSGGFRAQAPAGATITRVRGAGTSFDDMGSSSADGWRAGIADSVGGLWCGFAASCAWAGPPMLGLDLTPHAGATQIDLSVTCALWTGCLRDRLRAAVNLDAILIDVNDQADPSLDANNNGWSGGWNGSAINAAVRATDGAGVRRTWFRIDGGPDLGTTNFPCDSYAMTPCPGDTGTTTTAITTSGLADGQHTLALYAEDAGFNHSVATLALKVDNNPPVVRAVQTVTSAAWHKTNGFDLAITAADPAGGSGLQSIGWDLCRADGSACSQGNTPDRSGSVHLGVPGPGEWKARFWAADAVQSGAKSDWSGPLRFDDTVPGLAAIGNGEAWIGGTDAHVSLSLAPGQARGPSGIAGFAVSVGAAAPGTTVAASGDPATAALGALAEGTIAVKARAISGSGIPATAVASTTLKVDHTPPVITVERDPDGAEADWIGTTTRIAVHATDALSGMDPASAGMSDSSGAHISYAVDGESFKIARGGDTTIAIAASGDHAVVLRATDLAGNTSRDSIVRVRVDRTAPKGVLEALDPAQPRRLRATIDDLCVRSATLELRRRGASGWTSIEAAIEENHVWADVPDERLDEGTYDVRFRVEDCAGNDGLIDRFAAGAASVGRASIRLPLRSKLDLRTAFDGEDVLRGRSRHVVRMGRAVRMHARLAGMDGQTLAGRTLAVQERVGLGEWRMLATRVTDEAGAIAVELRPGPSRGIRVVAAPDDLTVGAISRTLHVAVPARATIATDRASLRNGHSVTFSGRVLGGFLPRGGRELELQGYNPLRGRWQPVRTTGLRCDGVGHWRATYRFTATTGTVTYRFRLRVPPRPDHPFADGYSRAVTVKVRG